MIKLLRTSTLVAALFVLPVGPAVPQGIPVIDTSQIAQVIATLQQQLKDYEEQIKQLTTMQNQLTNMEQRLQAITGAKGISSILNDSVEKTARQAASDLQAIVDGAISGNAIAGNVGDMNTVIADLKSRFDLGDLTSFDGSSVAADKAIASSRRRG